MRELGVNEPEEFVARDLGDAFRTLQDAHTLQTGTVERLAYGLDDSPTQSRNIRRALHSRRRMHSRLADLLVSRERLVRHQLTSRNTNPTGKARQPSIGTTL